MEKPENIPDVTNSDFWEGEEELSEGSDYLDQIVDEVIEEYEGELDESEETLDELVNRGIVKYFNKSIDEAIKELVGKENE